MQRLLFFIILLLNIPAVAQVLKAPAIDWQDAYTLENSGKNYGTPCRSAAPLKDGGTIVATIVDSTNALPNMGYHKDRDICITKYNANCNIEWQKYYGGSGDEYALNPEQTSDGGYIFIGVTKSSDGDVTGYHKGNSDIWIVKIDATGNIEWQKAFGGSEYESFEAVHQTKDGGYIVLADTRSSDGDVIGIHNTPFSLATDGWVVKLNSNGAIEWQKCLGGTGDDYLNQILETNDGGYITEGFTPSNDGDVVGSHGSNEAWVVKLNSTGKISWQRCYGGSGPDGFNVIKNYGTNGFILGGGTDSNDGDVGPHRGSAWLVAINETGNIVWQRTYGGSGGEDIFALQVYENEGIIFTGFTRSPDGDVVGLHGPQDTTLNFWREDYWVVKVDNLGNIKWQRCLGGIRPDIPQPGMAYIAKDNVIVMNGLGGSLAGDGDVTIHYTDSTRHIENLWLVKLKPEVMTIYIVHPDQLLQIYPNPAHNYVGIATQGLVQLRIIDMAGKTYWQQPILDNSKALSYYYIPYLAKGMYIAQGLAADGSIKAGKLIIE